MTTATLEKAGLTTESILDLLYGDIDGYGLASRGRARGVYDGEDLTYGDITPECVYQMLTGVGAKDGDVFYDLGSGTGKGVLFASLLFPLSKSVGIELVTELHDGARAAHDRYLAHIHPVLPEEKQRQEIHLLNTDMRGVDISDGDIVYSHCTCFGPQLMDTITRKCEGLRSGAHVITVSKGLSETNELTMIGMQPCQMAWGCATLYFYERL